MEAKEKNPFQATLNLSKTEFPLRANAAIKEPEILKNWDIQGLYERVTQKNKGKKKYILHFGPPYANGNLHLGHALSYILKDISSKSRRMNGYFAPLKHGWDCHGMPIELKALAEQKKQMSSEVRTADERVAFKKLCRDFANHWINVQREELKGFGDMLDYDNPYITMSPSYEASILKALARFVEQGYIERKLKTVPWCGSCATVLATAEIEYKDRTDPSIYMMFGLPDQTARMTFPFLFEKKPNLKLSFVLWTTTPWSIPLNRGVGLNPTAVYVVLQGRTEHEGLIVAKDLADRFCAAVGLAKVEFAEADAIVFQGKQAEHSMVDDLLVPIFLDEAVVVSEGTACLSCAPGCGPEDYTLALKHNLEIFSPLAANGTYTKGVLPVEFEGVHIVKGGKRVLEMLQEKGTLLHQGTINHSYPHCWRCRNGLMFRATSQWFCDLQKNDLVAKAAAEIDAMQFVPERGQARLRSFITNRTEWCISRQRQWGVPIPALLCNDCNGAWLDASFIKAVAERVAKEGIEFWDRMTAQDLVTEKLLPTGFACSSCSNKDMNKFTVERDILDVWFDSGASSFAVLKDNPDLGVPADVYFEGSDQHRGWFQSSLLCGMVLYGHSPMRTIVTHGYIVDENKHKMSKSLGNGVEPSEVITKYSRDVLRLWVAGADFENDISISDTVLANAAEMYKKMRNTIRFLLANLYDFDVNKDAVAYEKMMPLDRYALARLYDVNTLAHAGYDRYHFASVVQGINAFCTNTLSAVYLDILKDRLYVDKADSVSRRSAQTVLYYTLDTMTHLLAPVLSFLAEEVTDFYQKNKTESVHLQDFIELPEQWKFNEETKELWTLLESLRDGVLKAIEVQRVAGVIKHPYEVALTLWLDEASNQKMLLDGFCKPSFGGQAFETFLAEWCVVSNVTIVSKPDGLGATGQPWVMVKVDRAGGVKCPRCWQWHLDADADTGLCKRCQSVVK